MDKTLLSEHDANHELTKPKLIEYDYNIGTKDIKILVSVDEHGNPYPESILEGLLNYISEIDEEIIKNNSKIFSLEKEIFEMKSSSEILY